MGRHATLGDAELAREPTERQASECHGPSLLAQIAVPTLLMHGARRARRRWLNDGVRHVADHVSDPHLRKVADTGHFGVAFAPEPIADELIRFLTAAPRQS